jgi:hypothetical protein
LPAQYLPCFLLIYLGIERVERERALHDICLSETYSNCRKLSYV